MKDNKKKYKNQNYVSKSFFFSFFSNLIDAFYNLFSNSLIGSAFVGADRVQSGVDGSVISETTNLAKVGFAASGIRYKLTLAIEQSWIVKLYTRVIRLLLSKAMRVYGVFLMSFGGYSVIAYLIKRYAMKTDDNLLKYLIFGCTLLLCGFVLMFSDKKLSIVLKEGRLTSLILFRLIGLREVAVYTLGETDKRLMGSFTFGMVCGLLTLLIEPKIIILVLVCAALYALVMYSPEAGLLIMLIVLPFLKTIPLVFIALLTTFSYFWKLLRGKRNFKIQSAGLAVLIFALSLFLTGKTGVGGTDGYRAMLVSLCFAWSFFLALNLFNSPNLIKNAYTGIIISGSIVVLIGIGEYLLGFAPKRWLDFEMFSNISGRVVSTFENPNVLGEFLILILPLFLYFLSKKRSFAKRVGTIIIVGCAFACLYFTWSRGAWISAAFSLVLYILLTSKKKTSSFIWIIIFTPIAFLLLRQTEFWHRFASIGNIADSSTSYRLYIWRSSINMIRDFFVSGIGTGIDAFRKIYIGYSYAGIEAAPHSHSLYLQLFIEGGLIHLLSFCGAMFLIIQSTFTTASKGDNAENKNLVYAVSCGIIAFLLMGMFDYTFYNFRIQLIFWIYCGFAVAAGRNIETNKAYISETQQEFMLW